MKSIRILAFASLASLAPPSTGLYAADHGHGAHHGATAALTESQKKFLSGYEKVRAALAADDLATTKRTAGAIADNPAAAQIAKALSLEAARTAFKKLSADAVQSAKGHEGYYIANCPMADADWVQTSKKISNPYYGRQMATCGSIKE